MINVHDVLLDELNDSELYLLLHIAKRLSVNSTCFPKNETLCHDTKWSLKTVQKVKRSLIEKGFISVTQRQNEFGAHLSNMYRVETDLIGVFVSVRGMGDASEMGYLDTEGVSKNYSGGVSKVYSGGIGKSYLGGVSKNYSLEVLTSLSIDKFKNNNMVEKNFESEKSSFEPPLPPLVDAKKKEKSCAKKESLAFVFPDGFSDESKRLFMEFVEMRKKLKKPIKTQLAVDMQLEALRQCTSDEVRINTIKASLKNEWQGLFPDRYEPAPQMPPHPEAKEGRISQISNAVDEATQRNLERLKQMGLA